MVPELTDERLAELRRRAGEDDPEALAELCYHQNRPREELPEFVRAAYDRLVQKT